MGSKLVKIQTYEVAECRASACAAPHRLSSNNAAQRKRWPYANSFESIKTAPVFHELISFRCIPVFSAF